MTIVRASFIREWDAVADDILENAVAHGFWPQTKYGDNIVIAPGKRNFGEAIALIHTELSEALEAQRHGNPTSHVIDATQVEEELADAIIRIMDLGTGLGLDLPQAILDKHDYNKSRSYKHGKEF